MQRGNSGDGHRPRVGYIRRMHSHSHTHSPGEKKALQVRLRKIAGQIAAIERMVEDDRDCPEVLTQVVSVRKALKSFAQVVIHQHTHQCIEGAAEPKEAQRKLRELLTVLERYVE
jgi:DNA-binding FrmR family transcriptional regulator